MFKTDKKYLEYCYQEYNLLRQTMEQARIMFHARMLVFVTICSVYLSKIIKAFSQDNNTTSIIYFFLTIILLLIGYSTFVSIIDHHITITNYMKKLNKARGKIVSSIGIDDPILPISEEHPPFGYFAFSDKNNFIKGYPFIIAIINSMFFSSLLPLGLFAFSNIIDPSIQRYLHYRIVAYIFSVLLFILSLNFHKQKRCEFFRTAEKEYK